jgi:chromatin remodeling complex protein RSC6
MRLRRERKKNHQSATCITSTSKRNRKTEKKGEKERNRRRQNETEKREGEKKKKKKKRIIENLLISKLLPPLISPILGPRNPSLLQRNQMINIHTSSLSPSLAVIIRIPLASRSSTSRRRHYTCSVA